MNLAWFVYYGLRLGLTRGETIVLRIGEMMDLIACDQIYNGIAEPKKEEMPFDEVLKLR